MTGACAGWATALVVLGACAGWAQGGGSPADEPAVEAPSVSSSIDETDTVVGGRVRLTVTLHDAGGWTVVPPPTTLDLDAFRLRSVERVEAAGDDATLVLTLVPLRVGDQEIPRVPIAVRRDDRSEEVATEPVPIRVASNIAAAADSAGAPEEPAPSPYKPALHAERNWWPVAIAAGAFALAAVLGFWLFRKLRRRPAPAREAAPIPRKPLRPAWEIALERLDRIAAEDYVTRGELQRQYVEVTETLRQYLEDRYGVPALESTTEELNERLSRSPVSPQVVARTLSVLREADLVKFAKGRPELSDARSSHTRVREIVTSTMPTPEVVS